MSTYLGCLLNGEKVRDVGANNFALQSVDFPISHMQACNSNSTNRSKYTDGLKSH